MPLNYLNLDTETRNYMRRELEADLAQNTLYLSSRLNPEDLATWHALLSEAINAHDDAWLAGSGRSRSSMPLKSTRKPAGRRKSFRMRM